jgi:chromosome segregation ATPase
MNTNEILSGLNDAITAYHRVPELEREIHNLTEDRDFQKLMLEEANEKISAMQAKINNLELALHESRNSETIANAKIRELESRNAELDRSHNDLIESHRNALSIIEERTLEVASLQLTREALETRLADAKGYGERMADVLKSIGQKIVESVAEPEVSAAAPFPVSVTVELPVPTEPELVREIEPVAVEPLASPSGEDLGVKDHEVAAGCNPYRYW